MSRFFIFILVVLLSILLTLCGLLVSSQFYWGLILTGPLSLLGISDLLQSSHSLLRNYPIIGHMRWAFEGIRPEIRQYLLEGEQDSVPFSREKRSIVYRRSKNQPDMIPFGTEWDVYSRGYAWLNHSISPLHIDNPNFRIEIGGPQCHAPYSASVLNISAMSFGSLSANAIAALNRGANMGGFAHDTGEGSISRYHRENGGDLIWELGSGYFGCRTRRGQFDVERFREQASMDQVKMIELKLSQGAKPSHGGVLPAAKISPEIAAARGIPMGQDCLSPARHPAFSTPREMMLFIARLRESSGGKPTGFKLCIGQPGEFMAIVKAMLEEDIYPDFIVVDGKEGGTGAAPLEFTNRVGTPLTEGLTFVRDVLIACGIRDRVRLGASGKIISAFDIVWSQALGADWCNSARGFMFALGCIQGQSCHTNQCPVGVATQDPIRQRALVVDEKSSRVFNFHKNTLKTLADILGSIGSDHPQNIRPELVMYRENTGVTLSLAQRFPKPTVGELLNPDNQSNFRQFWNSASADRFQSSE